VDTLIIAGGMAYTFKKVLENMEIGNSLFDKAGSEIVQKLMDKAKSKNVKILLPTDFVTADSFSKDAKTGYAGEGEGIPSGWQGLDVGEKSIAAFTKAVKESKTILWNGPLGVFEWPAFEKGTRTMLEVVGAQTKNDTITIIGGGDTATAASQFDVDEQFSHVSTGGGASLELLEGKRDVALIDS